MRAETVVTALWRGPRELEQRLFAFTTEVVVFKREWPGIGCRPRIFCTYIINGGSPIVRFSCIEGEYILEVWGQEDPDEYEGLYAEDLAVIAADASELFIETRHFSEFPEVAK